jgi:hypothetical protein
LFPISIEAINFEGFKVNLDKIDDVKFFSFFSISIEILFEEIYAISIPEKKAENNKEIITIT